MMSEYVVDVPGQAALRYTLAGAEPPHLPGWSCTPVGESQSYQGGESPVRTGVTGRAVVRACREGVGPQAYRGYVTTHEPARG